MLKSFELTTTAKPRRAEQRSVLGSAFPTIAIFWRELASRNHSTQRRKDAKAQGRDNLAPLR
jgi:hypothetical protein